MLIDHFSATKGRMLIMNIGQPKEISYTWQGMNLQLQEFECKTSCIDSMLVYQFSQKEKQLEDGLTILQSNTFIPHVGLDQTKPDICQSRGRIRMPNLDLWNEAIGSHMKSYAMRNSHTWLFDLIPCSLINLSPKLKLLVGRSTIVLNSQKSRQHSRHILSFTC